MNKGARLALALLGRAIAGVVVGFALGALLNHALPATNDVTDGYIRPSTEHLRKAVEAVVWFLLGKTGVVRDAVKRGVGQERPRHARPSRIENLRLLPSHMTDVSFCPTCNGSIPSRERNKWITPSGLALCGACFAALSTKPVMHNWLSTARGWFIIMGCAVVTLIATGIGFSMRFLEQEKEQSQPSITQGVPSASRPSRIRYQSKTVFIPEYIPTKNEKEGLKYSHEDQNFMNLTGMSQGYWPKINPETIDAWSREGWDIKSARRCRSTKFFDGIGKEYGWGTEYILQRRID